MSPSKRILKSYVAGRWVAGDTDRSRTLHHAVTGEPIAECSSHGIDFASMLQWGRDRGGAELRALDFQKRGQILKEMSGALTEHRDEFHEIAASYGATKKDAVLDVDGGIGTLAFYSSLGRKKCPPANFLVDGDAAPLSKGGNFIGQHICVPLEGVAIQINAYNFPSWGMLEKLAPALLAGMPSIVKPATPTAWLTQRMVEVLIESGVMPEGSLQLICGSVGDLMDHLTCQDVIGFTGSARTGQKIRGHHRVLSESVRVNIEADSLNCTILGLDVTPNSDTFLHFQREVLAEMTVKAGQKCTAIRRILVPRENADSVAEALSEALGKVRVGDPRQEGVNMGPLVDADALASARQGVETLSKEAEIVQGDPKRDDFEPPGGFFMEPILLRCPDGRKAEAVHRVEVFGPVATLVEFTDAEEAVSLARQGGGSLVGSVFSEDDAFVQKIMFGLAPFHGRLMVMNQKAGPESTGHGVVMPQLVHGGPGRAGGGEELGGLRSVTHYMQRVAIQGAPDRIQQLTGPSAHSANQDG